MVKYVCTGLDDTIQMRVNGEVPYGLRIEKIKLVVEMRGGGR